MTARASETGDFTMLVFSSNFVYFAVYRPHKNLELTELSTQSTSLVYQKITALNATLYLTSESPLSSLIIALGLLKKFPKSLLKGFLVS